MHNMNSHNRTQCRNEKNNGPANAQRRIYMYFFRWNWNPNSHNKLLIHRSKREQTNIIHWQMFCNDFSASIVVCIWTIGCGCFSCLLFHHLSKLVVIDLNLLFFFRFNETCNTKCSSFRLVHGASCFFCGYNSLRPCALNEEKQHKQIL